MKRIALASLIGLALCAAAAAPAMADTQTATLGVSASLADTCTLTGGSADLGNVTASTTSQQFSNIVSGVTVTCNQGTAWSLAADDGANSSATDCPSSTYTRQMLTGTGLPSCLPLGGSNTTPPNLMAYDIYTDNTFANVLSPAGTSGGSFITGTGDAAAQAVPLNVEVGPTYDLQAGDYADTVNLTLTYN